MSTAPDGCSAVRDVVRDIVRDMADHFALIVWEADSNGHCTYLNPASAKGLSAPEAINISDWHRVVHPDDASRIVVSVAQAKHERREYQLEYRILRSDGSIRWIMESAAPRMTDNGTVQGYVGTLVDVSESHETRDKYARRELEHRLLTENAHDLISHSDANNVYIYVSPSHKDTLGYEPHELIGTHLYDYIHPDDLAQDGRRPTLTNIRFRHKNGNWVWLGASTRTIRDPQTGAKLGIVSIARDITAQLEAQKELARREERFRGLTSLSSDWYWETDTNIRLTFISDGLFNRLRVQPEQLLGTAFSSHVRDRAEPGLIACQESIAARRPFRDILYPAELSIYPGIVRYLRISGEPFNENGVFSGYRGICRDVTQEVMTARALERLATRDVLTELPNRTLLQARLEQRLNGQRLNEPQAIFFIDLDNFKEVNDSLGHAAGDALLKEIAGRFTRCVRPDETVARIGGDEFVIVAACRNGDISAVRLAEKLRKALEAPIVLAGHEVKVAASIGISLYPQDGTTSETLLQNADTALYRAKAAGGSAFRFYTAEMSAASRSRMVLLAALRHALARNEFEVYFQPRASLKTLEITGMEALLRWTHPELGAISPAEFIPLAEETGLIDEITDWVLRQATGQVQKWTARYGRALTISVNLSARQLRNKKVLFSVVHALRTSGLYAGQLELELTETALMEDTDLAAGLLKELKALGLRLSVDDFGTGYSSLAYLCRFPLDSLKLDRSFLMQKEEDDAHPWRLAEAIINLAHTLNLSVVAEGVESEEHLAFLRTTVCDEVQGTCISSPLPAAALEKLLLNSADKLRA
ncbi:MAG TPA: EAL domain-containing protein [Noviherbaspirillum sp.]|nr:EAL domain-containing protein [Noviherbaspirillum sp.]